jgi:hypothetical protein
MWQVNKQRRDAIDQQTENVKANLRLTAYQELQALLSHFTEAVGEAPTMMRLISAQMTTLVNLASSGQRTEQVFHAFGKCTSSAIGLISFLERYQSLMPGFDVFRVAIAAALHDIVNSRPNYDAVLIRWLPIDNPKAGQPGQSPFLSLPLITPQATVDHDNRADVLHVAIGKLQVWAIDLANDAQIFLLGKYKDADIRRRVAPDQTYFTVTANPEDRERIRSLFKQTAYWRNAMAVQQQTAAQFGGTPQEPLE